MGPEPIVETGGVVKRFPGVTALDGVDFTLFPGEVHSLVGENGAGKSTFIKVLSGALTPDAGAIFVDGKRHAALSPLESQRLGIQVIYQENLLVRQITVAENIFLGREPKSRFGFFRLKEVARRAREILDRLGIDLDPLARTEDLGTAGQQFLKIVKALALEPRVLIMDEPTTMFNSRDAGKVLELVRRIAGRGMGVIYISHNLPEVSEISDRITVLRDGKVVATHANRPDKAPLAAITRDMIGREVELFYHRRRRAAGDVVIKVENLQVTKNSPPVSFEVRRGEILGFAGMVGSGRTEIARAVFGAGDRHAGRIFVSGTLVNPRTPAKAIQAGMGFITEDRQRSGLILNRNIIENSSLAGLASLVRAGIIDLGRERREICDLTDRLQLRAAALDMECRDLSGGNQQKVVLAKWLFRQSEALIFDEPTRGIDVNAKAEIYALLSDLAESGKGIIMISSDMVELIAMADRVLVIRDGAIAAELAGEAIREDVILAHALATA